MRSGLHRQTCTRVGPAEDNSVRSPALTRTCQGAHAEQVECSAPFFAEYRGESPRLQPWEEANYTFMLIGSLLIHLRILSLPQQDIFWTVAHIIQFAGLVCIAYALHRRP